MDRQTVELLMNDHAAHRRALLIDVDGVPREFQDVVDDWQDADFRSMDPAVQRVCGRPHPPVEHSRAYFERPRGHSKTTDLAIMTAITLVSARSPISIVWAAGDRDQARLGRHAIDRLVRLNQHLQYLDVQRDVIRNPHNGATLEIIASDAATVWGRTDDLIIVDELSHWTSEAMWHTVVSELPKRSSCVMVVISNAGTGEGDSWQWRAREACRTSPEWYFSRLDGPQASWMSPEALDEQRRMLTPMQYRRVILNQWTHAGDGDALDPNLLEAATDQAGPITTRLPGLIYIGGLDIAVRRDWSALVVLALDYENRAIRLADVRVWNPQESQDGQVDLAEIESAIRAADRQYGLYGVYSDSFQSEYLRQRLEGMVWLCILHPTAPNLTMQARALLRSFQEHLIHLYHGTPLTRDLGKLRVVERLGGGLKLDAARDENGHADAAFALAAALPAALEILDNGIEPQHSETVLTTIA